MVLEGKDVEAQLEAMRTIAAVLSPLSEGDRSSVLNWVDSQFGRVPQKRTETQAGVETPRAAATRDGTVSFVAQKLGSNSCRKLIVAAAAHLTLFQGKDSFTRDELVASAREARGWKSAFNPQIARDILRLCKSGELFERSKDVFSLPDAAIVEIEKKLNS